MSKHLPFNWESPLLFDEQLSEEERMICDSARQYAQSKLMPRVIKAFRDEHFDREILLEMGAAGFIESVLFPQTFNFWISKKPPHVFLKFRGKDLFGTESITTVEHYSAESLK